METAENIIRDSLEYSPKLLAISYENKVKIVKRIEKLQPKISEKICYIAFLKTKGECYSKILRLKTHRFLTRKLKLHEYGLKTNEIQKIAEEINNRLYNDGTANYDINIIKGKEITKTYRNCVGNTSCMTKECCEYTLLYEMNPDKVEMIVAVSKSSSSSARCILWTLDNKKKLVSIIYYNRESARNAINKYVEETHNIYFGSQLDKDEIKVSNLEWNEGNVPYTAHLKWGRVNNAGNLDLAYRSIYPYELSSTLGGLLGWDE